MTSAYHYLVYVDGNKVRHHVADPLAAIYTAEQAMDDDPEQSVVIVVLDEEEAGYSAELYAKRPFMTAPDVQAAEAVLAARLFDPIVDGGCDGSKACRAEIHIHGCFRSGAELSGGEPRGPRPGYPPAFEPSPPLSSESNDKPSRSHLLAGSATCSDSKEDTRE